MKNYKLRYKQRNNDPRFSIGTLNSTVQGDFGKIRDLKVATII